QTVCAKTGRSRAAGRQAQRRGWPAANTPLYATAAPKDLTLASFKAVPHGTDAPTPSVLAHRLCQLHESLLDLRAEHCWRQARCAHRFHRLSLRVVRRNDENPVPFFRSGHETLDDVVGRLAGI